MFFSCNTDTVGSGKGEKTVSEFLMENVVGNYKIEAMAGRGFINKFFSFSY
jgi:hypothetical protein